MINMQSYEKLAKEIVRDYGIVGANKLIAELKKESQRVSDEVVESVLERHVNIGYRSNVNSYSSSLGHQISSVESGRITHR